VWSSCVGHTDSASQQHKTAPAQTNPFQLALAPPFLDLLNCRYATQAAGARSRSAELSTAAHILTTQSTQLLSALDSLDTGLQQMGEAGWRELEALTSLLEAFELQCQALAVSASGGTVADSSAGASGHWAGSVPSEVQQPGVRHSVYRKLGPQLSGGSDGSSMGPGASQASGLGLQSAGAVAGGEEDVVAAVQLLDRAARQRMQVSEHV
jgi:hypothetical protein